MKVSKRTKRRVAWILGFLLIFGAVMEKRSIDVCASNAGLNIQFEQNAGSGSVTYTFFDATDIELGADTKRETASNIEFPAGTAKMKIQISTDSGSRINHYSLLKNGTSQSTDKDKVVKNGELYEIDTSAEYEIKIEFVATSGGETPTQTPGTGESISVSASVSNADGTIADLLFDKQRIGFESKDIHGSFNGDKSSEHEVSITVEYGKLIDSLTINNIQYSGAADKNSATITVPAADSYTMTVALKEDSNRAYTVVWAYSLRAAESKGYGADAVVENGRIELIQVQASGGTTYSADQMKETLPGGGPAHEGAYYSADNETGYAMIAPGSIVTFRFIPAYGYQIARVDVNGQMLAPVDAKVGQFTYTMPSTDVHFQGIFKKQADQFNLSGAAGVTGASITNGANAASNGGNLRLTVTDHAEYNDVTSVVSGSDVVQLSSMDISLANIVSKGGTNGYWSDSVTSFDSNIGINLTLDLEALDAGETYSVVREHNGVLTELSAVYNAETNTFSFDTNQFSTYTIVKKTISGAATATPTATPIPTTAPTAAPLTPAATPVPTATPLDSVSMPIPDDLAAADRIENNTNTVLNAYNGNLLGSKEELVQRLLTMEEAQAAVINGESVKVYLNVIDISTSISAQERALVEKAAGNSVIGMYLDLTLFKQLGDNEPQQITNTNGKVTICIQVPKGLINSNPSITRSYLIVRIHDGVADILDCSFDELSETLVFETDAFSVYAVIYADHTVDDLSVTRTREAPKTADGNKMVLWSSLLALGCIGMVAADIYRRRRGNR